MKFLHDLRRRRVFRLAGLYIVSAWIVIEVGSVFFPAWGIPSTALRYLFIAAALLFPVALIFSWIFDVTSDGIVRTKAAVAGEAVDISLKKPDYAILAALAVISIIVIGGSFQQIAGEVRDHPVVDVLVERIENSVAVLPFTNLDVNADTRYFSDGITEEILHRLAATRALHVLGRTSSFAFRSSEEGPARIGEILGVQYLLHGSVRRDRDFVRVTARLIDKQGMQVWSQSFDRKLEAIFVIQSEIASAVASQIVRQIISTGGASATRSTDSMEAYNEYLVGRAFAHSRTQGWHEKAETAFRAAIELDPKFAPAHAGLAYALFVNRGGDYWEEARNAANRSLTLSPDLAEAHAIRGLIYQNEGPDTLVTGERSLRRAIELDPALSDAYNWLALGLRIQGRMEEANAVMQQGYEIDPLNAPLAANSSGVLVREGRFDEALRRVERLTMLPDPPRLAYATLHAINFDIGRYASALRWSAPSAAYSQAAEAYAALGMFNEAEDSIKRIRTDDPLGEYDAIVAKGSVLQRQGKHLEAWEDLGEYIAKYQIEYKGIDSDHLGRLMVKQTLAGRSELALGIFDDLADSNADDFVQQMSDEVAHDTLQALAFAYRQTGDEKKAMELLSYVRGRLDSHEPASPEVLQIVALNYAMTSEHDSAFDALTEAIELGWANNYLVASDPRWAPVLSEARFVALFERVLENLALQRKEVLAPAEAGT